MFVNISNPFKFHLDTRKQDVRNAHPYFCHLVMGHTFVLSSFAMSHDSSCCRAATRGDAWLSRHVFSEEFLLTENERKKRAYAREHKFGLDKMDHMIKCFERFDEDGSDVVAPMRSVSGQWSNV